MEESKQGSRSGLRSGPRIGLYIAVFVLGFIILGVAATEVWDVSNSFNFCAHFCHDVHPEEPAACADSYHANVKCTECHMGRVSTLQGIVLKVGHFRDMVAAITGNYARPTESVTLRPRSSRASAATTRRRSTATV